MRLLHDVAARVIPVGTAHGRAAAWVREAAIDRANSGSSRLARRVAIRCGHARAESFALVVGPIAEPEGVGLATPPALLSHTGRGECLRRSLLAGANGRGGCLRRSLLAGATFSADDAENDGARTLGFAGRERSWFDAAHGCHRKDQSAHPITVAQELAA